MEERFIKEISPPREVNIWPFAKIREDEGKWLYRF